MLAVAGENTNMILLGCLVVTAALAHLMAHTAVAATMFPILLAIYALYGEGDKPTNFGKSLFIGMAYAAGAGSIITFLGSARGPAAAGMYKEFTGHDIGFFELHAVPVRDRLGHGVPDLALPDHLHEAREEGPSRACKDKVAGCPRRWAR